MGERLHKLPRYAIGALLSFMAMVIAGIVGNRADHLATTNFPTLAHFLAREIPVWWVLTGALGTAGLLLLALWIRPPAHESEIAEKLRRELQIERTASNRSDQLLRMGDSLLRLLSRLRGTPDHVSEFERLLEEYLRDATGVFEGDVSRVMLLERRDRELVPWVGFQMPASTMQRSRFRLDGEGVEARGIATLAYQSETPIVVHFRQEDGRVVSDRPNDYIVFDPARPFPPYQSLIALPVPGASQNAGVLCFDSPKADTFDSPEIQALLGSMAAQIHYAIEISHRIGN